MMMMMMMKKKREVTGSDQLTKGILVEIDWFLGGVMMLPSYNRTRRIFIQQSGFHGMSRVLKVAEMMKSHHVCRKLVLQSLFLQGISS